MNALLELPPDSRALDPAWRAALLAAAARSRLGPDPLGPIGRALAATSLGLLTPAERAWAGRIEARKRELVQLGDSRPWEELGAWEMPRAVRWMSVPAPAGRALMKLVRELRPVSCLEVGTGFGISAAYLAAGLELNGAGRLVSVELDPKRSAVARESLEQLGLGRIELEAGEEALERALEVAAPLDFAFIDSDHREDETLATLEAIEPRLEPGATVILDDVGRSWAGVGGAWRRLAGDPRFGAALRCARLGILTRR